MATAWPRLPLAEWRETHDTLHMWMQIVGKTRLALAPRENHWWHVALYVTARGLTTTPLPYGAGTFEASFDFVDHRLIIQTSDGRTGAIALRPQAVADFYHEYLRVLGSLGITVTLWPVPVEAEHTIPFPDDRVHATYDATQANRFFGMLRQADRLLKRFKGRFLGKSSPVHFFWGVNDLALTRFNGRRAAHPDNAGAMLREANSHEEISVGFWPGRRRRTTVASWPTSSFPTKRHGRYLRRTLPCSTSVRAPTTRRPISLAGIGPRSIARRPNGHDLAK